MGSTKNKLEVCTFCSELSGLLETTNYGKLTGQYTKSRILWSNKDFAVIPSLGPLVEGHLLLIPKHHEFSFVNLSKRLLSEAEKLILAIIQFNRQRAHHTLIFEHGAIVQTGCAYEIRIKKAKAGACTDHAHIHIVPSLSASPIIQKIDDIHFHLKKHKLQHLNELHEAVERDFPYIIISSSKMKSWVLYVIEEVPGQFMRQMVASIVGLKEWNWYKSPHIDLVQKTIQNIGPLLNGWLRTNFKSLEKY
jgi:diadenosine tetraphosphate (Ap4A) HIT family hydrolase